MKKEHKNAKYPSQREQLLQQWKRDKLANKASVKQLPKQAYADTAPLSYGQRQLWTLNQLQGGAAYNVFEAFQLQGRLDKQAFINSIDALTKRHEILRTSCDSDASGWPIQRIHTVVPTPLNIIDLSHLSSEQKLTQGQQIAGEEIAQSFNLSQAPLWRATLIAFDQDEHVFLLVLHHIIADGWSLTILLQELMTLYAGYQTGKPVTLPALPLQYADYAIWQKQRLQGKRLAQLITYWQRCLENAPAVLELPTDFPRPPIQRFHGDTYIFTIPPDLTKAVRQLSREENSSLFCILLTAYAILLMRYSGTKDIVIGSPVIGRTDSYWEQVIGYFVNMLALRFQVQGTLTVRQMIQYAREIFFDGFAHQELPFEQLVEVLRPQRDLSYSPLFQVTIGIRKALTEPVRFAGLTLVPFAVHEAHTAKFDLSLFLHEFETTIQGTVEFNSDLFTTATVAQLSQHFCHLLQGMVMSPDGSIWDLPLLTQDEQARLLSTQRIFHDPSFRDVAELFEAQVVRTPDATAVLFGQHQLTYNKLNQQANQVAHYLRKLDGDSNTPVGILMPRSLEMVVAILGVLKAGRSYLPLDIEYPRKRQAFILQDADVTTLLATRETQAVFAAEVKQVLCLEDQADLFSQEPLTNPESFAHPDSLAYIIYTSGSTGTPKGVMISQRNLYHYLTWCRQTYPVLAGGSVPVHSSIGFDLTVTSLLLPLISGQKVILVPEVESVSGLTQVLQTNEPVSFIKITPSHLELLQHTLTRDIISNKIGALIIGGEALTAQTVAFWQKNAPRTQLFNEYGPTEATVGCCVYEIPSEMPTTTTVPIGQPITNTRLLILDAQHRLVPNGVHGELYIGGDGLARGYLNRPALTADRFVPDPYSEQPGARLYRTGDITFRKPGNMLFYVGRHDFQVKIRGFRIELDEIEAVLARHPLVRETAVLVNGDIGAEQQLVAYVVPENQQTISEATLRQWLKQTVPSYMVPTVIQCVASLPLTINGKIDRQSLQTTAIRKQQQALVALAPRSKAEKIIARIWQSILNREQVGIHDNFFDLGGHSLLVIRLWHQLKAEFNQDIPLTELFRHPTVSAQARRWQENFDLEDTVVTQAQEHARNRYAIQSRQNLSDQSSDLAIVGLAGRFPGADNIDQFWENLCNGVESITFFEDEELLAAGINPDVLRLPNYVKAYGVMENIEYFDPQFFGINAAEAEIMDPQHRIFLMLAWQAIEHAGYDVTRYEKRIGVYAGASMNTYILNNLYGQQNLFGAIGTYRTVLGNSHDFLATQVSYRLNLKGPSINVQSACSTSLVAVNLACQSLLNGECDMALAGGVSVAATQVEGYLYVEGHITSPDGHCRPFDAQANGTVGGSGAGVVVIKRLSDALVDGDTIHAIIKGSATNNDGARKIGYTAPSEDGQTEVIIEALTLADVDPETITYIETHGTGTALGDSIEVAALKRAFGIAINKTGYCRLGGVKSNIGHLDAAAGVAGLIKTVLALKHRELPPTLHFVNPNPALDLEHSPFSINVERQEWLVDQMPRRAGVSSFGIGGTNAHVIVEEAPAVSPPDSTNSSKQLLIISAQTEDALEEATTNLAQYLTQYPDAHLPDVAYTLQMGRTSFRYRRTLVSTDAATAALALNGDEQQKCLTAIAPPQQRPLYFMFPGQGAQHVNMGRALYDTVPAFRSAITECATLLASYLEQDLLTILFPPIGTSFDQTAINQTAVAQPLIFAVEYALAQVYLTLGLRPQAMIGHSFGEYVAACLAGIFSLEDALAIVATRGRLMQQLPPGSMLTVALAEADVQPYLSEQVSLAAINGPHLSTLSGSHVAINQVKAQLDAMGISHRNLPVSHAYHSAMMEPIMAAFAAFVAQKTRHTPTLPFISNVTGTWITALEATDPYYWATHLRQTVQFSSGIQTLLAGHPSEEPVLLEVGPGHTLCTLAKRHQAPFTITSLPTPRAAMDDDAHFLAALGRLWLAGLEPNWQQLHTRADRRRVPLPTYPFAREYYWIDPQTAGSASPHVDDWFYLPNWKRTIPPKSRSECTPQTWLLFGDGDDLERKIADRLRKRGHQVITAVTGTQFAAIDPETYTLCLSDPEDYIRLFAHLAETDQLPNQIAHLLNAGSGNRQIAFQQSKLYSYDSLIYMAQAIQAQAPTSPLKITVVASEVHQVFMTDKVEPAKALLIGPCKTIPRDLPSVQVICLDIGQRQDSPWAATQQVTQIVAEMETDFQDFMIAYRGENRLVLTYESVSLGALPDATDPELRVGGVYIITGGLTTTGLSIGQYLAQTHKARLFFLTTSLAPEPADVTLWDSCREQASILPADITNKMAVQTALQTIRAQFGEIHGVFHVVYQNVDATVRPVAPNSSATVLDANVSGIQVLLSELKDDSPDFIMLCSPLTAIVDEEETAVCSTSAYIDSIVQTWPRQDATQLMAITWDTWHNRANEQTPASLSFEQGLEAFRRILAFNSLPQLIVSKRPLPTHIHQSRYQKANRTRQKTAQQKPGSGTNQHLRPTLQTTYVPPRNEIEQELAEHWRQSLGFAEIGVFDTFFELGGHSLLATQLVTTLQDAFDIDLSLREFLEKPTIADLAQHIIEEQLGEALNITDWETLLAEVEDMPDEDE